MRPRVASDLREGVGWAFDRRHALPGLGMRIGPLNLALLIMGIKGVAVKEATYGETDA